MMICDSRLLVKGPRICLIVIATFMMMLCDGSLLVKGPRKCLKTTFLIPYGGSGTFLCSGRLSQERDEKIFWLSKGHDLFALPVATSNQENENVWQNVTSDKISSTLIISGQEEGVYICRSSVDGSIWEVEIVHYGGSGNFPCPKSQSKESGENFIWLVIGNSPHPRPVVARSREENETVWQNVTSDKSASTLMIRGHVVGGLYICRSSIHGPLWELQLETPVGNPTTARASSHITKTTKASTGIPEGKPTTDNPKDPSTYSTSKTPTEKPTRGSATNPSTKSTSKTPTTEVFVPVVESASSDALIALIGASIAAIGTLSLIAVLAVIYCKQRQGFKSANCSQKKNQNRAPNGVQEPLIGGKQQSGSQTAPVIKVESLSPDLNEITAIKDAIEVRDDDECRFLIGSFNSVENDQRRRIQETTKGNMELTEVQVHSSGIAEEPPSASWQPEERQDERYQAQQIQETTNDNMELTEVQIHSSGNLDSGIAEEPPSASWQPEERQEIESEMETDIYLSIEYLQESQPETRLQLDITTADRMRLADSEFEEQAAEESKGDQPSKIAELMFDETVTPEYLEEPEMTVVPLSNSLLVCIEWHAEYMKKIKVPTFHISCQDTNCHEDCLEAISFPPPFESTPVSQRFPDLRPNHTYRVTTKVGPYERIKEITTLGFDDV